ncbi:MAG: hypothetical protein COA33_001240 [Fluviicola sp.]|nr:hypothetical protein [Fluviicola sp.]
MIAKFNILRSALFIGALFLVSSHVFSQNEIELLPGSETLEYDEKTGVHRLIGNVSFIYQGNKMFCDSAHYFEKQRAVRAYGNVHINKRDTLNLFCDSLYYNGKTRKAKLWGNVRVRDNEFKLTTDTLDYDAKKGQAHYHYGGRVESILTQEILTSRIGYFHPNSKNFFFSKDVVYDRPGLHMETDTLQYIYSQKKVFFYGPTDIKTDNSTMYCESGWYNTTTGQGTLRQNAWISKEKDYIAADTLIYHPEEGYSIGKGNVYYKDSTQNLEFNGDYAYSSDTLNYSFLTGNAYATKYMKDDTMYVFADTLFMEKIDNSNVMKAYRNARIFSTKVQCVADSITFDESQEIIILNTQPIVWAKTAELKGELITIHLSDTLIHQVNILEKASIVMEVQKDTLYNQIAGKNIVAKFRDNDLYRADVSGNAVTIFYPEEEIKTDSTFTKKRQGMNRLYASDLRIDLDSNEISGITYLEEPDGAFYPMDQIKKDEQFISGFSWKEALRPKRSLLLK